MVSSCLLPIVRHEWVEILISANNAITRLYFPDIANIRNAHLRSIELYTGANFAVGVQNIPVLSQLNLQTAWLTLQSYDGREFVHQRPAQDFFAFGAAINFNFRDFVGQRVNWPKSYFDFVPPLAAVANDRVLPVSIYYQYDEEAEKESKIYTFSKKLI
jgi:hypothetical protein